VRYTRVWVLLEDALKLVQADASLTEAEAKIDLCGAIFEGKIAVQVRIAPNEGSMRGMVLEGQNVGRPPDLNPEDFDWTQSRPLTRWPVGPVGPQSYTWTSGWKDRRIDMIKLLRADVVKVLCGGGTSAKPDLDEQSQPVHREQRPASEQVIDEEINSEKASTAGSTRPLTERGAEKFTAEYIDRETQAGRRPTLKGLETAAKEENLRGGRDFLRAAYKQIIVTEVTRGRPRK
jgi:hypothetical protein